MFKKSISVFLCAFGVIPWYSFKKQVLVYPRVFKIYSVLLFLLTLILSSTLLYLRIQKTFGQTRMTVIVAECFTEIGYFTLLAVTILKSSFWSMYSWQDVFHKIQLTKIIMGVTYTNFYNNIWLLTSSVTLAFLVIGDTIVHRTLVAYYTSFFVYRYFYFLIAYTILSITNFLLYRYKTLNDMVRVESFAARSGKICLIKEVKKIYMDLTDIVHCFSEVIGWSLLLICFCSLVELQYVFTFIISDHFLWGTSYYKITKGSVFVNIGYLLLSVVSNN